MTPGLTYVVTGGCGFLGSRIVDMLADREKNISEIRVVDTNLRSRPSTADRAGVEVSLIHGDVTDMAQMTEACAGADVIIHTASLIDVLGLVSDATLWHVNVKGTENLLRCCVNEDIPSFVYTSSMEVVGPNRRGDPLVYGDESTPYDSSCLALPYGRTKAAAEAMVLQWNGLKTNGGKTLHTCSLRPGGIYGDGEMLAVRYYKKSGVGVFTRPMKRVCPPGPHGQSQPPLRRERGLGPPAGFPDASDVTEDRWRRGVLHIRRYAPKRRPDIERRAVRPYRDPL
ncbi:3 beta-hydroxysteroid dehydrogenase type 7-like isoform X1 [Branchiostoma floridae x Branchiostoma japonicum]